MLVGCYTLDCYCDTIDAHPKAYYDKPRFADGSEMGTGNSYTGRTNAECLRKARRLGWYITAKIALCPYCAKKAGK